MRDIRHAPDLSQVLDSLPQAVLIVSQTNEIHYANMAAENVFKSSATFLLKNGLNKILPVSSPVFSLIQKVFSNNSAVNEFEIDRSTPRTGKGTIVDAYAAPLAENSDLATIVFRTRGMADRIAHQLSHRSAARSDRCADRRPARRRPSRHAP